MPLKLVFHNSVQHIIRVWYQASSTFNFWVLNLWDAGDTTWSEICEIVCEQSQDYIIHTFNLKLERTFLGGSTHGGKDIFLDAIASPSTYPIQSVGEWVGLSMIVSDWRLLSHGKIHVRQQNFHIWKDKFNSRLKMLKEQISPVLKWVGNTCPLVIIWPAEYIWTFGDTIWKPWQSF